MRVAAFRKAACNPTSKQPSSLIVFRLLEMFSQKYLALVSSPWKPWKLYGGSSKNKVRSPKHFCFPFLLPTYHGEEVDKLLSPQDHLTHQALCAHMVLPQQHPHVQEETKLQFLLRMPLTHQPKPCCHCKNTELHGKVSSHQVRAARYFSQEKVWRKLCPPKAGIAELLQHLWFDPL